MRSTEKDTQVSRRAGREGDGSSGLTAEALAIRFGQQWELWRGNGWFAVRRCGVPCREPLAHGWAHIVLAYSVEDLVKGLEAQPDGGAALD